jgi:thymidylate synthase
MNYHEQYAALIGRALQQPLVENIRTSTRVGTVPGTQILSHWGPSIPIIGGRHVWLHSAAAEVAWYLSGTTDCSWLNKHTKMWTKWQNEFRQVQAAYGHRWRNYHGVDQLRSAVDNLKQDPTSRRIWIDTWAPEEDSKLDAVNTPCPLGFYLQMSNNQLCMSVVMRSSDIAVGLIYDTISFKLLHNVIAAELGALIGSFEMVLLNAHIYEPQIATIKEVIDARGLIMHPYIPNPDYSIGDILDNPDEFVKDFNQNSALISYLPKLSMFVAV